MNAFRAPALLAVATVAAWSGALAGGFVYDDWANVVRDPATSDPALILERVSTGVRVLTRASYALDHALWGWNASGFLLTNLLLHVATVLGVFRLARLRLDETGAFTAALVFALQPAHAEVVAWVSGRSAGLAAALLVWGLVAHDRNRAWLAGSLFALGCLARETALAFPLLVLAWEWTEPNERRPVARWFALALLPLAIAAASSRYRELLAYSLELRSPLESVATNLRALPFLFAMWIDPTRLSIMQPFEPDASVLPGVALVAALLACLSLRRRSPLVAFTGAWILAALAPTHTIIARIEPLGAKALYLAWLAPALAIGAGAMLLRERIGARAAAFSAAATLSIAGVFTVREARIWSDPITTWERTVRRNPADPIAWNDYGAALQAEGRHAAAHGAFRVALSLEPSNLQVRTNLSAAALLCGPDCQRTP